MTAAGFCPACGAPRIPGAEFCGRCGADLRVVGRPAAPVAPVAASTPVAPAPRVTAPALAARRRRAPLILAVVGVAVVAAVVAGVVLVPRGGPGASPAASPAASGLPDGGIPSPSLDADFPAFPVPAGSALLNAQVTVGTGPEASRIAAWTSPLGFDATVAFYTGLADPRWHVSGEASRTPQTVAFTLSDGSGVFASAEVQVVRANPVQIGVILRSATAVATEPPAASPGDSPAPTIAFGTLPPASALPPGFPARLVPKDGTMTDAGQVGGTYFATFTAPGDVAALTTAYQSALNGWATGVGVRTEAGSTVIDFTTPGGPGQIILVPGDAVAQATTVAVQVAP